MPFNNPNPSNATRLYFTENDKMLNLQKNLLVEVKEHDRNVVAHSQGTRCKIQILETPESLPLTCTVHFDEPT